ncbi:MAG: FmdB family zinc ribbon protein [Chloroflexota bacterium]
MPIYEYVCTACGQGIEVIHAISAAGPATCAACGGAMRKALSAPAIHFKGSGWAKVDARSTNGPVRKPDAAAGTAGDPATGAAAGAGGTATGAPAASGETSASPAPATGASAAGGGGGTGAA